MGFGVKRWLMKMWGRKDMEKLIDIEGISEFNIETEDGKKFCRCRRVGNDIVYISKEGSVNISSLMEQTYGSHGRCGRRRRESCGRGTRGASRDRGSEVLR